jgi:hypothetical protein
MKTSRLVLFMIVLAFLTACSQEEKRWEEAKAKNDVPALNEFIKLYPDSKHMDEAKTAIETLDWNNAFTQKNDSLLRYCVKTYPNSKRIDEAKDLISQIRWPVYELKKADCIEINYKSLCLSMGLHIYGLNPDGSAFLEPDKLQVKTVIVWRNDVDTASVHYLEKHSLCMGVAYLWIGNQKFRYLKKVDLNKSNDELAAEFGIKH